MLLNYIILHIALQFFTTNTLSAAAMLVGLVVGGLANLFVDDLALFSFVSKLQNSFQDS